MGEGKKARKGFSSFFYSGGSVAGYTCDCSTGGYKHEGQESTASLSYMSEFKAGGCVG